MIFFFILKIFKISCLLNMVHNHRKLPEYVVESRNEYTYRYRNFQSVRLSATVICKLINGE